MAGVVAGNRWGRIGSWSVAAGIWLALAGQAQALFHAALIDEVLSSYDGDPEVQFIEIRMLGALQNFVFHSVIAAFDADGNYIGDILEVPGNVANAGANVTWLVGTQAFATASGLTPDFIMPAGILPTSGGMVCFGGGGGFQPQNPPTWDRTAFSTYVDCVAYGTYAGQPNARTGTPTTLTGDGHSLQRMTSTSNNLADFVCAESRRPRRTTRRRRPRCPPPRRASPCRPVLAIATKTARYRSMSWCAPSTSPSAAWRSTRAWPST